ncbi:MAG TPA: response regulator [Longimicrobium sp.]|jgi:CheY-like chemotaxis protein|uniref:response regulator n=1 Tax=Longimicrobium sp. TaxID=2029185 RepID=UPI002EDA363C
MMHQHTLALADDDEMHAELMAAWLQHQGYRVLCFASGDELVSWAATPAAHADGLVLDVDMPGRDGYQSCREVRALPEFAAVPTVFVSASHQPVIPEGVGGEGVQFIRKDEKMFVQLSEWLTRNIFRG